MNENPPATNLAERQADPAARETSALPDACDREPGRAARPYSAELVRAILASSTPSGAREVELEDGAVLFAQGAEGDCVYVVLEGFLDVLVDMGFGPVRTAYAAPGELVGELAVFAQAPRTASVAARGRARLLRVDAAGMLDLLERDPRAARAIIADLGRRLLRANQPLVFFSVAAQALRRDDFSAAMLQGMAERSDELGPFAGMFLTMLGEIEQKHQRSQEMNMARQIQQSVLPGPLAAGEDGALPVDLAAFMRPMREIGGDFYDYFPAPGGRLAIAVGDVSGKGVPASLFMMMCRTALKSVAGTGLSVDQCVARLNAVLAEGNELCMFVTLFFALLDPATGELAYCNAGHNPPLLLRAGGGLEHLRGTGPAAGIVSPMDYAAARTRLAPGDRLFVFSDGVTEALSPEGGFFGEERLEALVSGLRAAAPRAMVDAVARAVDGFAASAEQADDITCLALALR